MTLVKLVEDLLYSHPPYTAKRELLILVRTAEEKYLRRIAELENDIKIHAQRNHEAMEVNKDAIAIGNSWD